MVMSLWPRFLAHPVYTNILSHLLTYWQTITTIIPMQKTPRINVNLYTWIRKKRRRRSILGVCTPVPRQHAGIGRVKIDIFFCAQVENRNIVASNSLSGFGLCLFVCLFVRTSLGKQVLSSSNFLLILLTAVVRSSSIYGSGSIRYVLPVLWITSRLHMTTRNERREKGHASRQHELDIVAYSQTDSPGVVPDRGRSVMFRSALMDQDSTGWTRLQILVM